MDKNKTLKDHRQIGQELDLFSVHEVAPGAIFWHHKGYIIYKTLVEFLRNILLKSGYQEISSPVMVKSELFKMSGHWEFYNEHMFNLLVDKEEYSLKPMNCPEASLIYKTMTRSYNDLPIRYSDFGILHRNELSGVLGGAFRVRQFTIDDAHHFIRPDQIQQEILELLSLTSDFYKKFNFKPHFYLATKPDKAMGDPKLWKEAEEDLEKALRSAKVSFDIKEKDGAFYGPKIDIHIKDSQDRDWQLATIQLDFQIPERMGLEYIDADGKPKRPVIVHRAILGSIERFIGILLEHYQGNLPLWLSPVQVAVLPVSEKVEDYARQVFETIKNEGIRVELDMSNKPIGAKIREATLQKIPFMCIIGEKEKTSKDAVVSVRTREGENLSVQKVNSFIQSLKEDIEKAL
ncbi:MAG: threonine--tRNA ligase [Candidatus Levybacteria bacterium RIFCSPHIGHO2_02_FULL_40_18]|nr:MAG: threonine--tRNA ligase [Candidatus Levybacteria bacterium RIFCSPHIGHO2_01_FULL_40_58]OGH26817.1 MAG: threonine--tRNA ligase [Candidatus Levybacteria bacterium RIFCSPHIGHO2_02_FULL_40_18]OGH31752.1 MAG: threonine--tRNA ligase [Candidatus Levybacteria bacterium RIFCSPHIGHO2_12_FULL_40_31]OGH40652.1 MAG: threonine--tRNA ligase [Candidatus Levybacteria bacterium RIFCSPLOWO2_01_FULL_40_64]OGH48824.1 MAG: threonine--tRNA ligase [Candidatus Levybacteria bacterium RIFCSPLOWO2_02_FULL_41_11]